MTVPVHVGIAHPNLWWLAGVAFLGFLSGLALNLYRTSRRAGEDATAAALEEETK